MNIDEYVEKLKKRVSEIMFQNREMFPIVDKIFISKDFCKIQEKYTEFYVRYIIENLMGLSYIIRNKVNAVEEIRYTMDNIGDSKSNIMNEIEIALIKSVLFEYVDFFKSNLDEFNKIKI
jgi:hypothetical protein